jgi:hypothetical protein
MEIYLSMFSEFLLTAPKATIEPSNSVVILVMPDLGSATWAANAQPNHEGCPWKLH